HLPEKERQGEFEIYARQLYQGEEVGRVTWKLVPPGRQPRPCGFPPAGPVLERARPSGSADVPC
ncbi:MAG TPA: hypothetical protein PK413_13465, partial [Thermoanaerobaculia bacterium]|nr:hypothetical protein [Thermoanaerobaculia bacterium]